MARIRTIKPEFFTSLTIADLPLSARLTFIGLWTHVDDGGRCVDEPRLVRAAVWPLDDRTAAEVEDDLRALHDASLIHRYEHAGRRYLAVTGWKEHQRIDKPRVSKIPSPEEGTPVPPTPPRGVTPEPVTSEEAKFPEASGKPPGNVGDASATPSGALPVGKEQGREQGREGEGNPPTPRPDSLPVPAESEKGLPDRMLTAWWDKYGRRTAQGKRSVRQAITDALGNGIDSAELWAAMDRLGDLSKPISGGTLQFALADIRKATTGGTVVPFRDRQQQQTDDWYERAMARAAARDAQEQQ
ncbi:hypothetical protein [Streptomyces sp. WMMC897]|uniref:hypothetical protein n=1 Tax=Streptomyces sp. WMMC897 TaxID=3014782 RepID=UPI0022B68223|nr:hypothetical protein [Streptomyces sp. WMMC897]MCZ7413119.1 hypothetical protein [Streptomyces sp. WMMC897]MCZ7415497.1 hypothetical protein [Streptomyces sp. WMMC897]